MMVLHTQQGPVVRRSRSRSFCELLNLNTKHWICGGIHKYSFRIENFQFSYSMNTQIWLIFLLLHRLTEIDHLYECVDLVDLAK